ncbi:UMP-CMP kinase [Punctularia strigosozonata HHB-11173 SS5]|uniref:UMP-CMP kinase n=1 Tax=Punctularia strigosozonata (strain HHB-11173) TaxID=741275 RepID=UPI00044169C4|nr:UMP-CMP kinase [Punctularia strigosozonata HHB-11173 SS5]EIN07587.1 UMP-CMP kinase [Punctularia strigosozonata HHB-11173 SS5]
MPAIIDKIAEALHLRKEEGQSPASEGAPPTASTKQTVFDSKKITVLYVLGGPGAGKGTQCAKLVEEFHFCHLSAGDLLRAEQNREGSEYKELIQTCIREGKVVPMEVTIKLLENAMHAALQERTDQPGTGDAWVDGKGRFLIDGFPRKMDQALAFDEDVCPASLVLFFTTTEEVMLKRLLKRGETSGREDDNEESIKKRFQTYKNTTMPVIEHYNKLGIVAEIDSSPSVDEVYENARAVVLKLLAGEVSRNMTL